MDKATLTRQLKEKARELGFSLVGVTSPDPPPHLDVYKNWLGLGHHGELHYLETEQSIERREDPKRILPECKSVLVLGISYDNPDSLGQPKPGEGRIAAYAWRKDYHEELGPRLNAIVVYAENLIGHPIPNRWYNDSGPVLERELAQRAGLGWIGKNSMLINPQKGSYFLIAEILLGIELEFDNPISVDHCGSCRRCIDACPTDCILEGRTLDATRCISYLTIELKSPIQEELRPKMGDWIFGCDICQIVCPWNERFAASSGDPAFTHSQPVVLRDEIKISVTEFNKKFKTSPVQRAKRRGYLRNISIALGNTGQVADVQVLREALTDDEPLVRGHTAWALGQIGDADAKGALKIAAGVENDPWVQKEIQDSLS